MILNLILSVLLIWYILYSFSFISYMKKKKNYCGIAGYCVLLTGSVILFAVKFIFI